jgi:septum formation inhibitor MinC
MGRRWKKGAKAPANDNQQIDFADLPAMSDEALKQLAVDKGIELGDGYNREWLIEAITKITEDDPSLELLLSDEDLKTVAEKYGIDPAAFTEKKELIKAIEEKIEGDEGAEQPDQSGGNQPKSEPPKENLENPDKGVVVISTIRAGKTIVAVTGNPITFGKDGKAIVDPRDAEYLNSMPGFGAEE